MTDPLYQTNSILPSIRLAKVSSGHQRETCTLFFRGEYPDFRETKTLTDERLKSLCKPINK